MAAKVTFDEVNKIVQVTLAPDAEGVVSLDVKIDLYSDGKEDWLVNPNLRKRRFPITAVGGNPLPGSKSLGSTFFLDSDWKIRPYEGSHIFRVNGNLYSPDGTSPFTPTVGSYNIFLEQQVSSLVDSTVAQLKEIEYASFNGGVSIDVTSSNSGTGKTLDGYLVGTPAAPVNNIDDAYLIAVERGFTTFYVVGDLHITAAIPALYGYTFIGAGKDRTVITLDALATVENCAYYDANVVGTLDGNSRLQNCVITNLIYVKGFIEQCVLSPGTIVLAGSEEAHFLDCWSGQPGTGTPVIDMGGSGQALSLRNYNGGIKLVNKSGPESVSVDLNSGQVKLDMAGITDGTLVFRGVGKVVDAATDEIVESGSYGSVVILNETVYGRDIIDIRDAHYNRRKWDEAANELTIYEKDKVTPKKVFNTNSDLSEITPQ